MEKTYYGRNIWLQVAIMNILLVIVIVIDGVAAAGRVNLVNAKMRRVVRPSKKPAGVVKTIQSEDGDIIDCVDIYKQPAFDHPALKNHTIQMRPSDDIEEMTRASKPSSSLGLSTQPRPMKGRCPQGTIPILRTRKNHMLTDNSPNVAPFVEEVKLTVGDDKFYGASAYINIWQPYVEPGEDSSALIILRKQTPSGDNFISAGWMVSNWLYGDQRTRSTVYWTADGSRKTGCYNFNCAGFIQTSPVTYIGGGYTDISVFNGPQFDFHYSILLDKKTNNWWLKFGDLTMGYWPGSIFRDLSVADTVNWGGQVNLLSARYCGMGGHLLNHSNTQMGSGHYPSEGARGKSAYVTNACYAGDDGDEYYSPINSHFYVDNPYCYAHLDEGMEYAKGYGQSFYFGGNGQQEGCF